MFEFLMFFEKFPTFYLSVIVWESVSVAKSWGQQIWLKLGREVGCDEIFQKPLRLTSPPFSLELQYRSKVSWQSVASLDSWLDSRFSIPARIENKLSRIASRIESRRTENKRFTHDSFLDNFSKTYSCNTTWQGYIRASDCMLETRPIQVIKRMFLQGQLYQASFPQLKFQIPAPNANKQCVTRVQATACLFCNVNFGAYLLCGRLAW